MIIFKAYDNETENVIEVFEVTDGIFLSVSDDLHGGFISQINLPLDDVVKLRDYLNEIIENHGRLD